VERLELSGIDFDRRRLGCGERHHVVVAGAGIRSFVGGFGFWRRRFGASAHAVARDESSD